MERGQLKVRTILPFFGGRISTAKEPNVIYDLTCLVFTISVTSQKSIIELRNTLRKTDSQDTAPGIIIFSDFLNLTLSTRDHLFLEFA